MVLSSDQLEARLRASLLDRPGREEGTGRWSEERATPALRQWLWQQTGGRLRPAAVLVPLMRRREGVTVLLTRRADHLRTHQGQVSFPGGSRDPQDESAPATALREAWEEVGLPAHAVEICGYLDDYPTLTGFLVTPVVGLVEDFSGLRHDPREVADVFEVPLAGLMEPGRFERQTLSRDGLQLPFVQFSYAGHRVWGATAAMLHELVKRLQGSP